MAEKCNNDCVFSEGCRDSAKFNETVRLIGSPARARFIAKIRVLIRDFYKNLPGSIVDSIMTQSFLSNDPMEHNIHVLQSGTGHLPCFNNMKILLANKCQVAIACAG